LFPEQLEIYRAKTKKWQESVKLAEQSGKNIDVQKPKPPYYDPNSYKRPGVLYMGMISPLLNYTIKGVIWYQGESNTSNGCLYKRLFPAMITGWRKAWNQGDFPFFFVQLANFDVSASASRDWALLREAQTDTLSLPNTAMVVTIDIGEANNIHPKNKQELGRRLALAALAKSYGKDIEYSGPMYKSFNVEDNKIIITLNHSKGLKINGSVAKGFQIASEDRNFVDADAVVTSDDKIKIWNDSIEKPVAVRYGWSNNPENCNLYNSAGLPASPFRTDSWPSVVEEKIKTETKTINAAN
jgi:sialate O-acetylesterase